MVNNKYSSLRYVLGLTVVNIHVDMLPLLCPGVARTRSLVLQLISSCIAAAYAV